MISSNGSNRELVAAMHEKEMEKHPVRAKADEGVVLAADDKRWNVEMKERLKKISGGIAARAEMLAGSNRCDLKGSQLSDATGAIGNTLRSLIALQKWSASCEKAEKGNREEVGEVVEVEEVDPAELAAGRGMGGE